MAEHHDHQHCTHNHNDEELLKKIKDLPLNERVKVVALYFYTKKKENLDNELEARIKSLQKEYDQKAIPIYDTQSELIQGKRNPNEEELKDLKQFFNEGEALEEHIKNQAPLENFWGQAIKNCTDIQERLNPKGENEKDADVLKYLERVQVEYSPDSDDFTIKFTFKDNEYFTNTELTKKFFFRTNQKGHEHDHHHKNQEDDDDFPFKSVGTEIQWKEGKNITKKIVSKKQKNKKTGQSRTVNKTVEAESFFNFFRSLTFEEKDQLDDEAANELDEKMEADYEIGRTFADELIPYSLEYFLGINPENDDEDFDDVDEDEDDKDGGDETDSDDEKKKKNRKKSGDSGKAKSKKDTPKGGAKDAPKDAPKENVDCKQQ